MNKKRKYSFLNIAGLAIGVACASMIFLWVEDELTFNHNFSKRDRLYQIYENQTYEGKKSTFHAAPGPMAAALPLEIPGIVRAARTDGDDEQVFSLGDKAISEKGHYADSALFEMLELPFVQGQAAGAFRERHSIVISETMARKFFGADNAVGHMLRINNEQDFRITGVFKDLPKNSSLQFSWLAPMENALGKAPWQSMWGANWARTYVELEPNADIAAINKQLAGIIGRKSKGNDTECFLFAMNDWNLYDSFTDGKQSGGRITYVKLFAMIAGFVLVIACINFMNLSTARSEQRAKEVGVRKVLGAGRGVLIRQFVGEALGMAFAATALGILLVYTTLPAFNTLVAKDLAVDILSLRHLGYTVGIGLVTGLLAGSYPAFYLSSFKPVMVLKGLRLLGNGAGNAIVRKGLVVVQFSASIVLIIGTILIYRQIEHVRSRDIGYTRNDLVYMPFKDKLDEHFDKVYQELRNTGVVENASLSYAPVTEVWNNNANFSWEGMDASKAPLVSWEYVNANFLSTMRMKLLAGRDFYTNAVVDSDNVIINEAMAAKMGSAGHVGGTILNGKDRKLQVVGIVKDFLYNSVYDSAGPLILYNHPVGTTVLSVRLAKGDGRAGGLAGRLGLVEKVLKANSPSYPVDLRFVDTEFDTYFRTEMLTGKLAGMFAVLAVVISCLGLFGLAAYTAERRVKEIGIRKVLGASTVGLVSLLSRQFLQLVGVSCLIAFPVAYWALNNWLQNYSYHTQLYWWIFALAAGIALVIALVTVSFQAVRAAMADPVKSLRTE